jgi:hypothetical protein
MNPIEFPQQTTKLAKSQPQYRVLPVDIKELQERVICNHCKGQGKIKQHSHDLFPATCPMCQGKKYLPVWSNFTCKYQLSAPELAQIIETGCLYISQTGYAFNPILPQIETPYGIVQIQYKHKEADKYDFWVPLNDEGELQQLIDYTPTQFIKTFLAAFPELTAEQIYFVERPEMAIDVDGNITEA